MKFKISLKRFFIILDFIIIICLFTSATINIFYHYEFTDSIFKTTLLIYISNSIRGIKDILDERLPNRTK